MTVQKIVLVGANGHLGPYILKALLNIEEFKVSVLTRSSSKSRYPENVNVLKTDDDLPYNQLVEVLKGQDALVLAFSGSQKDNSIKLANAAYEAGMKHLIPAEFGSCDSADPQALDMLALFRLKKEVREHLIELSRKSRSDGTSLSFTSIVTGHFLDYGLEHGLFGIDLKRNTVRVFDEGTQKFAATSLSDIGLATARVLQEVDDPRLQNKLVYIQSIQTCQYDMVTVIEGLKGSKLKVTKANSKDYIIENKKLLEEKPSDPEITEQLVTVGGIVGTNWDKKGDAYINDLVQMPQRDLKVIVQGVLR